MESLKSLGLSEYEAKVFIALQRLGVGTARDIYRLTDVPRSQVYGAAESLEERGLVEIQQSKPMEYRPVTLDEAKSRLQERFEEEQDRAFDYLENAREESEGGGEEREDFWTVKGRETIDTRVESLLDGAESRIIYNTTDADLVDETVVERLEEKAHEGVTVFVLSSDPDAREMFEGTSEEITVLRTPE
ncbi:MAG: helix-turn-helix domain-containing protein, partial [Halobacteria archaeon]|nr:helix-turn-helix domain-containing protein [Halobacteria archaeon]